MAYNLTPSQAEYLKAQNLSLDDTSKNQFNIQLPSGQVIAAGINPGQAATIKLPTYTPTELTAKANEYLKSQGAVAGTNLDPYKYGGNTNIWTLSSGEVLPVGKDFYENLGTKLYSQEGVSNIQTGGIMDRSTTAGANIASQFPTQTVDPKAEMAKALASTPLSTQQAVNIPSKTITQGSTAINTNFQMLPGESLAAYSARVTPLGGVAPTASQFAAAGGNVAGTPGITPQTTITPAGLQSAAKTSVPQHTTGTDSSSYVANIGTISGQLQQQLAQANQAVSETEAKKTSTYNDYINSLSEYATKGAAQTQAETAAGIPQQQQELANINAQVMAGVAEYNQLKNDYDRMSLENRARSATMARVIGREAAIDFARVQNLNGKAADIGLLQAQALGKSGQIEAAQKAVDKAVDLKYEDKLSRIKILEAQLASISADLTKEEKVKADLLTKQYKLQTQSIEDAKAAEKSIQELAIEASRNGASQSLVNNMVSSGDPVTAAIIGAKFLKGNLESIAKSGTALVSNDPLVSAVMANPEIYNDLTSTVKGKIASDLAAAGFTGFGKPLSDAAINTINQTQGAITELGYLKQVISENQDKLGPITGLAALNPYSEARKIQADVDRIRQTVGKALEGGVLRKEDEEKYKKILATLTDTPATAIYKIDALLGSLQRDIENYTTLQGQAGRNVGGIVVPTTVNTRETYGY